MVSTGQVASYHFDPSGDQRTTTGEWTARPHGSEDSGSYFARGYVGISATS